MGEGDENSHSSEEVVDPTEKQMHPEMDKRDLKRDVFHVWKVAHLKYMHTDKEGPRKQHYGRRSHIFLG